MGKKQIIWTIGLVFCLFAAAAAFAGDSTVKIQVQTQTAEVRLKPGPEAALVAQVKKGDIFFSEGKDGDWFRITLPENDMGFFLSGYIHQSQVMVIDEEEVKPAPINQPPSKQPSPPPAGRRPVLQNGTRKGLYLTGTMGFGIGFSKILVGTKKVNDNYSDVNIFPGGGVGILAGLGYSISDPLKAEMNIGYLASGSSFSNGRVYFRRFPLSLSLVYLFPSIKSHRFYASAGPTVFLGPTFALTQDSTDMTIDYKTSFGFSAAVGVRTVRKDKRMYLFGELKYMGAFGYNWTDANFIPVYRLREMTGHGIFLNIGIGYFLKN